MPFFFTTEQVVSLEGHYCSSTRQPNPVYFATYVKGKVNNLCVHYEENK